MANRAEQYAWVERVFGITLAAKPRGAVAYGKLLIEWRTAQRRVLETIDSIGSAILARDDVKADPRLEQVRRAVRALPSLVPQFGSELEDLIDGAMSAGPGEAATSSLQAAQKIIPRYRNLLASATRLSQIEALAKTHLGGGVALVGELDRALGVLEQELSVCTAGGGN